MAGSAAIPRVKLVRRLAPDHSQLVRRLVQGFFVLLNVWLGLQFYLWVRALERGDATTSLTRPPGAEGWLPIAGLMNFKFFATTAQIPTIHPAALFLFIAFCAISLLLKKAFCSWICPVGTLSEALWIAGRKLFTRNVRLPRWLDLSLRSLKYLLFAFFLVFIAMMSADQLRDFMQTPMGLLADIKMLNFFRTMSFSAALIILLLVFFSMIVQNFWCRYLCPYGALMGLLSLLSPFKIRRDAAACIDCAKCAKACPSALPVDKLVKIQSAECTGCMSCIAACPAADALQFSLAPRKRSDPAQRWKGRRLQPVAVAAIALGIFLSITLYARATGHWKTNLPREVYLNLLHGTDSAPGAGQ
jgi:polyferredoxin